MGTTTDKLNKLIDTKAKIKEALEEKMDGQEVSDVFSEYPALIGTLPSTVKSTISADLTEWFKGRNVTSIDLRGWDLSGVTALTSAFASTPLTYANLSNTKSNVTSIANMFGNCGLLEEVDVTGLVTSACTSIANAFYNCSKLKKIKGLDTWDASNSQTQALFLSCSSLEELDLRNSGIKGSGSWTYNLNSIKKLNFSGCDPSLTHISNVSQFASDKHWIDEVILRDYDFQEKSVTPFMYIPHDNIKTLDVSNWKIKYIDGYVLNNDNVVNVIGFDTWGTPKLTGMTVGCFFVSCPNLEAITG